MPPKKRPATRKPAAKKPAVSKKTSAKKSSKPNAQKKTPVKKTSKQQPKKRTPVKKATPLPPAPTSPTAKPRTNKDDLADQAAMERLVSKLTPASQEKFKNTGGDFRNIKKWPGLKLNSDNEVIEIDWSGTLMKGTKLEGKMDFRGLPPKLDSITVSGNNLSGPLDLTNLPKGLSGIFAGRNNFSGAINLSNIPDTVFNLELGQNTLSGDLVIPQWPKSIWNFMIDGNNFSSITFPKTLPQDSFLQMFMVDYPKTRELSGDYIKLTGKLDRQPMWIVHHRMSSMIDYITKEIDINIK